MLLEQHLGLDMHWQQPLLLFLLLRLLQLLLLAPVSVLMLLSSLQDRLPLTSSINGHSAGLSGQQ
jgi:hypothetical protein